MKFNIYFENNVPISENISKSDEFKKLWAEKEIAALSSYYEGKCKIKTEQKAPFPFKEMLW